MHRDHANETTAMVYADDRSDHYVVETHAMTIKYGLAQGYV